MIKSYLIKCTVEKNSLPSSTGSGLEFVAWASSGLWVFCRLLFITATVDRQVLVEELSGEVYLASFAVRVPWRTG